VQIPYKLNSELLKIFVGLNKILGSPKFHEMYLRDWAIKTDSIIVSVSTIEDGKQRTKKEPERRGREAGEGRADRKEEGGRSRGGRTEVSLILN
jgi:hypothetical protein